MKSIFSKDVIKTLREYKSSRDDINILCAIINNSHEMDYSDTIIIDRLNRYYQHKFPELRGKKWEEHQKYSRVKAEEYRQQEGPEDLSEMFEPIRVQRETNFEYIIRKLKSIF